MLSPSLSDLLLGVADALADDVIGKLQAPADAAQLAAAIDIVRRVAIALPQITAASVADSVDVAETLLRISELRPEFDIDRYEIGRIVDEFGGAPWAIRSLDELERINEHLRSLLARAAAASFELDSDSGATRTLIRAALRRMTERELALGMAGSPTREKRGARDGSQEAPRR
jgi:hypothetical protein